MNESSLQNLIKYLRENHKISESRRGTVKVDEFTLAGNGLAKKFYNHFFSTNKKELQNIQDGLGFGTDKEIVDALANILPDVVYSFQDMLANRRTDQVEKETGIVVEKAAYLNSIPVVDMEHVRGEALMVNKDTGRVVDLSEKSWARIVGTKHTQTVAEIGYCGRFEYKPRNVEPYRKGRADLNANEIIYNKFIPPKHRIERNRHAKLDPRYITFIEGLFLNSCKDYAYNWIYHSVYNRVPVYLVLVGVGGIGKNLLAESLRHLHGNTNFTKAPPSCLDTKFNGHLMDCTMIYYDECKFSAGREGATTRKNKLKEWANSYVPVELKGVDAKNKDIFCSAVIATNNNSDVNLERLDRKFSVMELSDERVEKRLGQSDTDFVWKYIETPDFPCALLNWLESRINLEWNSQNEYKGPKFDELVISSLSEWKNSIREQIMIGDVKYLDLKFLADQIPTFPSSKKVEDFLNNYREDGERLGELKTKEGRKEIQINDYFLNDNVVNPRQNSDLED